jgi:multicomponent Na+:H+ antiporter subunit D
MLLAMGISAALCIGIGLYPQPLYDLLPYAVDYVPYTPTHVVTQAQLILFAAAAFAFLYRRGWYPPELRSTNLDFDVVYRRAIPSAIAAGASMRMRLHDGLRTRMGEQIKAAAAAVVATYRSHGWLSAAWSTGTMVWWVAAVLGIYLVLSLV